jgi:hypothetical protein
MTVESVKQAAGAVIQRAAEATGANFGFLMKTAARESGYNPAAHAASSSAAGLFQFVEQTWLGALKRHGAKHGYGGYADLIHTASDGRLSVAGDAKKAVLALRMDPRAASMMAGELASDNSAYLKGRVGREPTAGELYIAHFLGPKGSGDLIEAAEARPRASAAALFPEAAAANPAIFYRDGRSASVAEVYANLTSGQAAFASAPASAPAQTEPQAPPLFMHRDVEARLARIEQERELADMIMGMDPGENTAFGFGAPKAGGTGGLANSMFSTEMLTLLSQARQGGGSGSGRG